MKCDKCGKNAVITEYDDGSILIRKDCICLDDMDAWICPRYGLKTFGGCGTCDAVNNCKNVYAEHEEWFNAWLKWYNERS